VTAANEVVDDDLMPTLESEHAILSAALDILKRAGG
jgi:hypothetical protein